MNERPTPFEKTPAMRLRTTYLTLHRHFQRLFARFGVTADQFVLMKLIVEREGAIQRELVEASGSDPNTIAGMLRRMEERAWIIRHSDSKDARARRVHLTDTGRALLHELEKAGEPSHSRLGFPASPEQAQIITDWLEDISRAMDTPPPA